MKKIFIYCIILNLLLISFPAASQSVLADANSENIFYVSPTGNDANPGTEEKPWKTMWRAAEKLTAGQTAIFEDGVYEETRQSFFRNSGTKDKPIIFKARNPHKAVLRYSSSCSAEEKLNIWSEPKEDINGVITFTPKQYITIKDFEITQEEKHASSTRDILVNIERAANCSIIGNKIHNSYEEGIKVYLSSNITIADNRISDTSHEGIDCFALAGGKIYNNSVSEFGRDGYMIKGNTCNTLVYGNIAENKSTMGINGFDIGGSSNLQSPISADENSYENYNSVFCNNIVYSQDIGGKPSIKTAFAFLGAKDCRCINNTIIGTEYGIQFQVPGNDWPAHPNNVNSVVKNNIMSDVDCVYNDNSGVNPKPQNVVRDYNLFINCGDTTAYPVSDEVHSIVTTENVFVDYGADWHILKDSPAVGTGDENPLEVPGFPGFAESDGVKKNYPLYEYDSSRKLDLSLIGCSGKSDMGAMPTYEPSFNSPLWTDDMSISQKQTLEDVTINRCSSDIIVNDGTNKVMALGPQSTSQDTYWSPSSSVADSFKISMNVKVSDVNMDTITKANNNKFLWRMYFLDGNNYFGDLGMRLSYPGDDAGFNGYNIRINGGAQSLVFANADGTVDWIKIDVVFNKYENKMILYVNDIAVKEAEVSNINLTKILVHKPEDGVGAVSYFDDLKFFSASYGYTTALKNGQAGVFDSYKLPSTDGYGEYIKWDKGSVVTSSKLGEITYYGQAKDRSYSCRVHTIRHYELDSLSFVDRNNNPVSGPVAGGRLSEAVFRCNIKPKASATAIFTYFDGHKLINMQFADISSLDADASESIPVNLEFDREAENGCLKVFIIDGLNSIRPIDTVAEYTF